MGHGFHFSHATESFRRFEDYSWALLEIPSNFAELTMGQYLFSTAPTPQQRFAHLWQDVLFSMKMLGLTSAGLDLSLAIAARRRTQWLSVDDLDELALDCWQSWFGNTISPVSPNRWVNDHHLYLTSTRHTGFLYQFAWFSAMSLLRLQRTMETPVFEGKYRQFLTHLHAGGVEDLMREHFDVDVSQPDLWEGGLALIEERVTELDHCMVACGK
jgi:oligoendopeptidase F